MKEEMAGFLLEISTKQQQLAAVEERQRAAEQQRQVRLCGASLWNLVASGRSSSEKRSQFDRLWTVFL